METLEEAMHIVKGKRTKRQRVLSPIPFSIPAHSNSSGDGSNGDIHSNTGNNNNNNNNNMASSPATSADEFAETATEEEEDMANCLILLAQGRSQDQPLKPNYDNMGLKFTSKRFVEAPATGNGKVGMYVYQCKTCGRTFPSFQALGGHRASHKKPKAAAAAEAKRPIAFLSDDDEEEQFKISLHLMSNNNNRPLSSMAGRSSLKLHECSICGSEFTSGQALGGHMRRHRGPAPGAGTNTTLCLTPSGLDQSSAVHNNHQEAKKARTKALSLDLDLNLPAPEDHHHHQESKQLAFASKQKPPPPPQQQQQQQQKSLVLSTAPALVDCHY
ncbi:zinc finger protein ZAT5-like isoform X2 [Diospyros lotus]|nr:zinc finger protein ZAT5-like isoform X2 [Diospyros lotus]